MEEGEIRKPAPDRTQVEDEKRRRRERQMELAEARSDAPQSGILRELDERRLPLD